MEKGNKKMKLLIIPQNMRKENKVLNETHFLNMQKIKFTYGFKILIVIIHLHSAHKIY